MVRGARNYVDWLPYDQFTVKRAKRYFSAGDPFSRFKPHDVNRIDKICIIRNAIAHRSKHSLLKFRKEIIRDLPLLSREKKPIGFLRSVYQANPQLTRYDELSFEMARLATLLCRAKLKDGYLAP